MVGHENQILILDIFTIKKFDDVTWADSKTDATK